MPTVDLRDYPIAAPVTADARLDLLAQDAALAAQAAEQAQPVDPATSEADPVAAVPQAEAMTTQEPEGVERLMLADDKLPVVLVVVLIVWAGILLMLWRTERRLTRLEGALERRLAADLLDTETDAAPARS